MTEPAQVEQLDEALPHRTNPARPTDHATDLWIKSSAGASVYYRQLEKRRISAV